MYNFRRLLQLGFLRRFKYSRFSYAFIPIGRWVPIVVLLCCGSSDSTTSVRVLDTVPMLARLVSRPSDSAAHVIDELLILGMFASDLGELFNNAGSSASDVGGHFTIPNNLSVTSANLDLLRGIGASHSGPGRFTVSSIPQSVNRSTCLKPPVVASTIVDRQQQQQFFHSDGRISSDSVSELIPSSDPVQVSHKLDSAQPQQRNEDFTSTSNYTDNAPPKSATKIPTSGHHRGTLRCPFCDKAFSNSSAIAKHKLTHSDERKYVCSICHKAFKRQDHLNGHKYTHETKKPHACHFCDKSYSDARSLRRHYENAHPEEYDRWLMLSQATNGDTSAFAVAAAALLSSTSLDSDAAGSSGSGNSIQANTAPASSSSILNALSNPVCKLLASNLTRASTCRMDGSPMSSNTVDSHAGNDAAVNGIGLVDRRSAHKHKSHRSTDWTLSFSPRSSNSGCSLSNATSPSGTLDTLEREDDTEDKSAATLASLSSLTATDMAAAAKMALMMAHPLEAPKRVACAVCQKRFKNQSALNGHMRLHGGYGPAGLTAISITTTAATTNSPAQSRDVPVNPESVSSSSSLASGFVSSVAASSAKSHETIPEANMLEDLLDPLIAAVTKSVIESTGSIADSSTTRVSGAATWSSDTLLACRPLHSSTGVGVMSSQENFLSFPTPPPPPYHPSHRIKAQLGNASQEDARGRSEHTWFQGVISGDDSWLSSSTTRVPTPFSSQPGKPRESTSTVTSSSRSSWWTPTDSGQLKMHPNRASLDTHSNEFTSELRASRIDVYSSSNPLVFGANSSTASEEQKSTTADVNCVRESSGACRAVVQPTFAACVPTVTQSHPSSLLGFLAETTPKSVVSTIQRDIQWASQSAMRQQQFWPLSRDSCLARPPLFLPTSQFCQPASLEALYSPVTPASANTSSSMTVDATDGSAFTFPPGEQHLSGNSGLSQYSVPKCFSDPRVVAPTVCLSSGVASSRLRLDLGPDRQFPATVLRHHSSPGITLNERRDRLTPGIYDHDDSDLLMSFGDHASGRQQRRSGDFSHPPLNANASQKFGPACFRPHSTHFVCSDSYHCSNLGPSQPQTSHNSLLSDRGTYDISAHTAVLGKRQFEHQPPEHQQQPNYTPHTLPAYQERHSFPNFSHYNPVCSSALRLSSANMRPSPSGSDSNCAVVSQQQALVPEQPERTRHISAPILPPCSFSQSYTSGTLNVVSSSFGLNYGPWDSRPISCSSSVSGSYSTVERLSGSHSMASHDSYTSDLTSSDAVADLLMQSHITNPLMFPGKLTRHCDQVKLTPLQVDAEYANQVHVNTSSSSMLTPVHCLTDQSHSDSDIGHSSHLPQLTTTTTDSVVVQATTILPRNVVPNDDTRPLVERFELADLATGSCSADESDNSAVARLSKSLAEDNLFRNPHTVLPPKKAKRKPAPIFIPPQTSANLSRLRSPRIWTSESSSFNASPPPYTPPPMLSPNRRGSGLFSSLTARWSSSVTSPVTLHRRNSSQYPSSALQTTTGSADFLRSVSNQNQSTPNAGSEPERLLKRNYASIISCSANAQPDCATAESGDSIEGRRHFAYPRRRRQLTPKSAPMVLLNSSALNFSKPATESTSFIAPPNVPAEPSAPTVFGYDDETMRRFAEADAADRARRLCQRQRRRCDTEHGRPHQPFTFLAEGAPDGLDIVPEKLSKLESEGSALMNYRTEEVLELVEHTLASLDEEASCTEKYLNEDIEMDELDKHDDEEDEDEDEEGVPSSLIPRINVGDAFQAVISDYCPGKSVNC
ncbi:hypothetical protein EG68_02067 [Paragonimus skrjabini miyazakii]|uniref:C2H2-type domain-containing protein n=1 Tax=Paragonimus skrjabini miyazakii TaxID=59628 RepID=A0A8S9YXJ5_9TREM|nr:hypothetical protein EG68_02067 [Paragonimus skrjabini miyazakii]